MSRLNSTFRRYSISCVFLLVLALVPSFAQTAPLLAPDLQNQIDGIAHHVLETTGVPSASLAVVKDGKMAYVQAYGEARLEPRTARAAANALQHWLHQ